MISDEELYILNNASQNNSEKSTKKCPLKKILIIVSILIIAITLISVILILLLKDNNDENKIKEIGEINCIFEIDDISEETSILSETFEKTSNFDIIINNKAVEYTKKYKFEKTGLANIQFVLYEDISLDNMFKGINQISSIIMTSTKNAKIKSMESTFESCSNLKNFTMTGFNLDELKSTKKCFIIQACQI